MFFEVDELGKSLVAASFSRAHVVVDLRHDQLIEVVLGSVWGECVIQLGVMTMLSRHPGQVYKGYPGCGRATVLYSGQTLMDVTSGCGPCNA